VITCRDVIEATGGRLITGKPTTEGRLVSIDTRTIKRGDIFVALRGPRFDGHSFLATAADRGAAILVIDRLDERLEFNSGAAPDVVQVSDALAALQDLGRFCRKRSAATMVGITGSNGKTTTKEMLASILRLAGPTLATRGNLNNHIGLPLMLTELVPEHRFGLLELGTSKKGDMDVLLKVLEPSVGLITNVGKDHLEFLETPEGVLAENRRLLDRLPDSGAAVINLDDPLLAAVKPSSSAKVITYGETAAAQVRAERIVPATRWTDFELHFPGGRAPVRIPVSGRFQVSNALAAAATALAMGITLDHIVNGLAAFTPAKMRMQISERPDGVVLVNDAYNANPSSVEASVASFCESFKDRPRWLVLGDMRELGNIARREHLAMGQWLAKQPLERIFLYGRDTRFVLEGLKAAKTEATIDRFQKKRYLIEALDRSLAKQRPAVLFKASRSLGLEHVIAPLLPSESSRAPAH
jgi:UDP-N-acetylmuramoyl-tripeptide--D-alanyl-D-alanine ligase